MTAVCPYLSAMSKYFVKMVLLLAWLIFSGCDAPVPPLIERSGGGKQNAEAWPLSVDHAARRAELDRGPLVSEMESAIYEQFLNAIWDDFNRTVGQWQSFRSIHMPSLSFGTWGISRELEHHIQQSVMNDASKFHWGDDQWKVWLDELESNNIRLEQMQWRHVGFDPSQKNRPVSRVRFEFHARRSEPHRRWILRGLLGVAWIPPVGQGAFPEVSRVEVLDAELLQREGLPPFEHVVAADISPADQDLVLEPNLQAVDLNADGLSELMVSRINRVFWNSGQGKFRTGSMVEFPIEHFHQGVLADFNGDGLLDFLAVSTEGLGLYAGDGKGAFSEAPMRQALFGDALKNPFVLTAGDIDGDGDLDVWLGQYKVPYQNGQMPTPFYDANDGHPSFLLRNDGLGRFTDITSGSGLEAKRFRRTYSGSLVDLDQDRDLDLLVVSDFAGADVYLNQGDGTFEDVTAPWLGVSQGFGMAHAFGDWNEDGYLDFLMIGMHSSAAQRMQTLGIRLTQDPNEVSMKEAMSFGNRVFYGAPDGFSQQGGFSPVHQTGWSWGVASLDFDLDGDEDIYIVNGHISGARTHDYEAEFWREDLFMGDSQDDPALNDYIESKQLRYQQSGASYGGYERNRFFLNLDGREWVEVAYLFGLSMGEDCRNVVSADLDGNGLPDLAVTTFELWPDEKQVLHLFPNFYQSEHEWVGVNLLQDKEFPPLMGAQLKIETNRRVHTHHIVSGDGYRTQSPYQYVLGLRDSEHVQTMVVEWPNGQSVAVDRVKVNEYNVVGTK